jgi:cytoskeletal protein CcmA (bactofilin family)
VYLGQQVFIRGTINGDVAMMCQQLTIEGTINGNLDLLVQQVTIAESGVVTGDLHAEDVQMLKNDGEIRGEITGTYQLIKNDQQADTEKE